MWYVFLEIQDKRYVSFFDGVLTAKWSVRKASKIMMGYQSHLQDFSFVNEREILWWSPISKKHYWLSYNVTICADILLIFWCGWKSWHCHGTLKSHCRNFLLIWNTHSKCFWKEIYRGIWIWHYFCPVFNPSQDMGLEMSHGNILGKLAMRSVQMPPP